MDGSQDPSEQVDPRQGIGPHDKVCGNCRLWRPARQDPGGRWVGPCRLAPGRGDIPPTAPICERFLARGSRLPEALPEQPTRRRSRTLSVGPQIRRAGATRRADEDLGDIFDMTRNELIEIIREALGEDELPALASRWDGGTVVLRPANPELQPREIPIDSLFRKVVTIRDRLRVLEAKINGHAKLTDAEKIDLQTYITRCQGSLTTFNLLFRDKEDVFVGEKGKAD